MHQHFLLLSGAGTRWGQLLVALSLLILLHEFGHFFFARLFKTRVEKFYLFFDFLFPFGGLFNFSLFKKKIGDTEYGIGWFPLGGYVKIAGMMDESMDKEQLAKPPEPWEYRSKPAWQRLFIMLGGIIMNMLVAMVIYMFVYGIYGEKHLPMKNITSGFTPDSLGSALGIHNGDQIVSINGKPVIMYDELHRRFFEDPATIEVARQGKGNIVLDIPKGTSAFIINNQVGLVNPRIAPVVGEVIAKSEAARSGLQKGDSIILINGEAVRFYDEVPEKLQSLKGQPYSLGVMRNKQFISISGRLDSTGKIGMRADDELARYYRFDTTHYNPIQAIGKGVTSTFQKFGAYFKSLGMLGKKGVKVSNGLGGFGTFAKVFPTTFDMEDFLRLMAFISVILAFMNLLPIPGLDGGYVVFTLWEMITGKKVSDKVMEVATTIGLVLLLALMLYANGLDIFRYFKK